jgi:hypothetical protein
MTPEITQFSLLESYRAGGNCSPKNGVKFAYDDMIENGYIRIEYFDEHDEWGQMNIAHVTLKGLWHLFLHKKHLL